MTHRRSIVSPSPSLTRPLAEARRWRRRWQFSRQAPAKLGKVDLVQIIAERCRLRDYLELCTPTTGNFYGAIDRARFDSCRRLMYRCPPGFNDGLGIDIRSETDDIDAALDALRGSDTPVSIALVDGFHTYDCAIRDLTAAFDLLADGGALVVHDCLPPSAAAAAPDFVAGEWCGVAYKAFLDFVLPHADRLDYRTVDTDYGCGIIVKNRRIRNTGAKVPADASAIAAGWFERQDDYDASFAYFAAHAPNLLRLVSPRRFVIDFETTAL